MACWAIGREGGGCPAEDQLTRNGIADDNGIVVTARIDLLSIGVHSISSLAMLG